jgi:hypothetical protein
MGKLPLYCHLSTLRYLIRDNAIQTVIISFMINFKNTSKDNAGGDSINYSIIVKETLGFLY